MRIEKNDKIFKDYENDPKWRAVMDETWSRAERHPSYSALLEKVGGIGNLDKNAQWNQLFRSIWRQVEREKGLRD